MTLDERLAAECADWVAEQLMEEFGGFLAPELVELIMEHEATVRAEAGDAEIDHHSMAERLMPRLEEEGVPVKPGGVTRELVQEILHWEDEFLGLAGHPRSVRGS